MSLNEEICNKIYEFRNKYDLMPNTVMISKSQLLREIKELDEQGLIKFLDKKEDGYIKTICGLQWYEINSNNDLRVALL